MKLLRRMLITLAGAILIWATGAAMTEEMFEPLGGCGVVAAALAMAAVLAVAFTCWLWRGQR